MRRQVEVDGLDEIVSNGVVDVGWAIGDDKEFAVRRGCL